MHSTIAPRSFTTSVTDGVAREWPVTNPTLPEAASHVRQRMAVSATLNPSQIHRDSNDQHFYQELLDALAKAFRILDRHLAYWVQRRKASRTPTVLFATRCHLEVLTRALNEPGTSSVDNVRRAYTALHEGYVSRAIRAPPIHCDSSIDAKSLRKRATRDRIYFKRSVVHILDAVAALIPAAATQQLSSSNILYLE